MKSTPSLLELVTTSIKFHVWNQLNTQKNGKRMKRFPLKKTLLILLSNLSNHLKLTNQLVPNSKILR